MLSNDLTENANAFILGRRINFFTPHHWFVVTFFVLRQPMQAGSYHLWVPLPALSLCLGLPEFGVCCFDTWKLNSWTTQTDPSLLQGNRWGAGAGTLSQWEPGAGLGANSPAFLGTSQFANVPVDFSDLEAILMYLHLYDVTSGF